MDLNRKDSEMERMLNKGFVLAVGIVIALIAGCGEQQLPSEKKSRLIAVENAKLKKEIAQRDLELENLKGRHTRDVEQREQQLAKCRKRVEDCTEYLHGKIEKQMDEFFGTMMEGGAKALEENNMLRAEIAELRAKLKEKGQSKDAEECEKQEEPKKRKESEEQEEHKKREEPEKREGHKKEHGEDQKGEG
jgi:hypothetical protein